MRVSSADTDDGVSQNRSSSRQGKDIHNYETHITASNLNKRRVLLVDKGTQHDNDSFLEYLVSFMNLFEQSLRNGKITVKDLPGAAE